MTRLTDIIEIQISRETATVAQESFNIPLFIGEHTVFTERARYYGSLADVQKDFGATSNVTKAATSAFSQANKPRQILIGRKAAAESWVDSLFAIEAENNSWYGLTTEAHDKDDVLALAAAIEARRKVYAVSSQEVASKGTGTDSILASLKALGYMRTFFLWEKNADTEFPEMGWMTDQLQETPGSNTWAYKDIIGATPGGVSNTEAINIHSNNGSTFEEVGGLRRTVGGKMVGGEWIDVIVFVDWLEARLSERLWRKIAVMKKLAFTNDGAAILETEIYSQLREGVRNLGLAPNPAPRVVMPDVDTIDAQVRGTRVYEGITFTARLAGAIHFVGIKGTVTS